MRFRERITIAAAAAVAVATVAASFAVYAFVRGQFLREVDEGLRRRASAVRVLQATLPSPRIPPPPPLGGPGGYTQYVDVRGNVLLAAESDVALPVSADARAVASGDTGAFLEDARIGDTHVRVITVPFQPGVALQVARPLDEVDRMLGRLRWILLAIGAAGVGLALLLGRAVARAALVPVDALTQAVEHVAATRDTSRRIDASGEDELARLAGSFNTMLAALDDSVRAQRQLVADASHELRTPLTSLRTNVEVLARASDMPAEERERVLRDITAQLEDLTALVTDLVELARGAERSEETEPIRLDELAARAVALARLRHPGLAFVERLQPCTVAGVPSRLQRALANLLDNAAKWSPPGGAIDVELEADGTVRVRDRGPGFEAADLPRVFDRFYRAPAARALPGSGLGLAIVRQVAESHGGFASASNHAAGGAVVTLKVPADAG